MMIIPAIDIIQGQCVRLRQGDYQQLTIYPQPPLDRIREFEKSGYSHCHIVDLDGAKNPDLNQYDLILEIAKNTPLKVQVGGGIRDRQSIERLLNAGVKRVVIGSLAVKQPQLVQSWIDDFSPEKIVLALDVRCAEPDPMVLTSAWQEQSSFSLWNLLEQFPTIQHVLCTDIARDGMLQGPNFDLYSRAMERYPQISWQASGGIRHQDDVIALKNVGVAAAIIGKALYQTEFQPC